ncbi:hypothetical protein RclHR1_03270011 [Rhizophagus clarus]|uniref:Granulins domain-containing protein n=1 Tax=Rhizophagus clarus TaxID=94130 RepID=A0A2Z6S3G2_9GLOM|nr:hypothetical protein RclHR1_03270011 [Rhizophagus clarus]GES74730.1 hypothetical protein GLOIN_2v1710858 [Rhizophagus clarus]
MKLILIFVLIIVAFSNFAATESLIWKRDESRTTAVEKTKTPKNSPLVARELICPSGTYECNDSEGGCCSYGATCLPNFKCSASTTSSVMTWKRDESRITTVEKTKTLKNSTLVARELVCPSETYECNDSEGGCCSYGTTCLPDFKCSAPTTSSVTTWKRDESRITTVEKTKPLKNSPLVARELVCPSGTYECSDSEGGCCSYGTICLPDFKCSSGKPTTSSGMSLEASPIISQIFSIVLAYLYLV